MRSCRKWIRPHGLANMALGLLLALAALAGAAGSTPAQAQSSTVALGPIVSLAVDNVGGGWGWTGPSSPQDTGGHLLRLKDGSWQEVPRSDTAVGAMRNAAAVDRFALSGDGKSGWAVGTGGGARLWRLKDGVWQDAPNPFPKDSVWSDLTLAADGSDGYIVAADSQGRSQLARLRNDVWKAAEQPAAGEVRMIALSPSGERGWAIGPGKGKQQFVAVQIEKSGFVQDPASVFEVPFNSIEVVADNVGNGWVITPPSSSALVRLTPKGVQQLLPDPRRDGLDPYPGLRLQSVAVNGTGRGWATAYFAKPGGGPTGASPVNQPLLFSLDGDRITEVPWESVPPTPQGQEPNYAGPIAYSSDGAHAWLGASTNRPGFLGIFQMREAWLQTTPRQADPLPGAGLCFNESRYCLRGAFAAFWQKKGGLDSLGYPITPEIWEQSRVGGESVELVVQYTQRARLEWHPEHKGTEYEVLLGLLGNTLVEPRLKEEPFLPKPASAAPGTEWFKETQHNLGPPFISYWRANGGLPVFGYPRSEAFEEKNQADGKVYRVQYFERNRIEHHPENQGTRYEFLLGLLGVEQFKATYGYVP